MCGLLLRLTRALHGSNVLGFLDGFVEAGLYPDRESALRGVLIAVMEGVERKKKNASKVKRGTAPPKPKPKGKVPPGRVIIQMKPTSRGEGQSDG